MDGQGISATRIAQVSEELAPEHEVFAGLMREPDSRVVDVPVAAFQDHEIWRFEKFTPRRPVVFYVASGPAGAELLTGRPEAWNRVAEADGGGVASPDEALAAAKAFVEATRLQNRRLTVVEDAGGLPWRPNLDPDGVARRRAAEEALAEELAPRVDAGPDGFSVDLAVVSGMDVERRTYRVGRDGTVSVAETRGLESALPFTYVG